MENRKRIVRQRGTGTPAKTPENRVQLRQEWVTMDNTQLIPHFMTQKPQLLVTLEHKVQEVI